MLHIILAIRYLNYIISNTYISHKHSNSYYLQIYLHIKKSYQELICNF